MRTEGGVLALLIFGSRSIAVGGRVVVPNLFPHFFQMAYQLPVGDAMACTEIKVSQTRSGCGK